MPLKLRLYGAVHLIINIIIIVIIIIIINGSCTKSTRNVMPDGYMVICYSYNAVCSELCECNEYNSRPGNAVINAFHDRCARASMGIRLVR